MFRGMLCILFLQLFHQIQPQTLRTCFLSPRPTSVCDPTERYRTITGSCNNIDNPTWGMPGSQLHRLVSSAYSDGIGEPRGGYNSRTLPNPRYLSQRNHPDNDNPDTRFTHMVMQFGQFLDHDITVTPKDETLDCCKDTTNDPKCFIIQIPPRDRFYSWVNHTVTCLNLVRSTPLCQTPQREQYNGITSYIDASTVYGSEVGHAAFIRKYEGGELMENDVTGQLPTKEQLNLRPDINRLRKERQIDFVSGDERTNEHPFLTSMHIVFLREHNRIARELRKHLPTYLQQDEFIYQESRRLVGAQMQNIVYGEFLPTILGAKYMKKYNLLAEDSSQYDPRENPSVIHAFTVAAFRFGHSMINSMFMLKSGKHDSTDPHTFFWRLREIFDGQTVGGSRLPLENMLEGLCSQMPQTVDPFFSTEITNHLFQKNKKQENFGQDLLAINVQRGRDHGIPGYNAYRKYCGLSPMTDWTNKPSELSEEYWLQLKDVYDKVDDIDLMVGGVAETNVKGGAVGPTFACIIGEQFKKLKYGDRFFYTHQPDSYHSKGLSAVSKSYVLERTLGDILCENSEIAEVQQWVTLQPDNQFNKMELCSSRAKMDLKAIAKEITDEAERKPRLVEEETSRLPRGSKRIGRKMHPESRLCFEDGCSNLV